MIARARRWLASDGGVLADGAAVAAVALAPRAWFLGEHPLDLFLVSNMEFLDARARHLLAGTSSPVDTFTPVGYPALVAIAHAAGRPGYAIVGAAQAILGAATCALATSIARRLSRSRAAARAIGLAVGLALAFYLPLVVYTGFLLTETLFAFLVTLLAWLLTRAVDHPSTARAASAGLVLGAAATVRPNLLLAIPFLGALAWSLRRRAAGRAWTMPLVAVAFAVPPLAAVAAHNSQVAGRLTGLATNGGVNFLLGHCGCRAITFPPGDGVGLVSGHQNRIRFTEVVASPRSAFDEGYYYRRTFDLFREHPARALAWIVNVTDGLGLTGRGELPDQPYYPGWMGHEGALRAFGLAFAWLAVVPAAVHALLLALRARAPIDPARGVLYAWVAAAVATLLLYLGDPRLRVPFDPILLALAADAWASLGASLRRSTAHRFVRN